jgi:hypothetical protein
MTPTDTDIQDAPDEVALPAFEDALWSALRTERRRYQRAGRRSRVLVAAAVVAVLAGAGAVAATRDDGTGTTTAGPSTDTTASTTTVPLTLEQRAAAAIIARAPESVVREDVDSGITYSQWGDGLTLAMRTVYTAPDGRVLGEQGQTRLPDPDDPVEPGEPGEGVAVNHCRRTVIRGSDFLGGTILGWLGSDMERGIWASDGTEVIDGRELIRLRTWAEADMPAPDPETDSWEPPTAREWDLTQATYLDPETLMPVLTRYRIGAEDESRVDYTIFPRDEESLANVLVTVPDGYTELPRGDWDTPIAGVAGC